MRATALGSGGGSSSSPVNLPSDMATGILAFNASWTTEADLTMPGVNSPSPGTPSGTVSMAKEITYTAHAADIENGSFAVTASAPITDTSSGGSTSWTYQRTVAIQIVAQLQ